MTRFDERRRQAERGLALCCGSHVARSQPWPDSFYSLNAQIVKRIFGRLEIEWVFSVVDALVLC